MRMEQQILEACGSVSLETWNPKPSLKALSSIRSLIVNPHTSPSAISSILQSLTASLPHPIAHPHVVKLLTDLASLRPHLSQTIFNALLSTSPLSSSALSALSSLADRNGDISLRLDPRLFLSLCFGTDVRLRLWLLRSAGRLGVESSVMFTVFLGFTRDPYPYVREAALNGLRECGVFGDRGVAHGCYNRAVELLADSQECVRSAAVRVVSEWGLMLMTYADKEGGGRDWSDVVFLQLCSVVRDMSTAVRIEVFNALGKIKTVSEDVLLQTLSKKVLLIIKERKFYSQWIKERFDVLVSSAAGAFVHGLEDEFYEVRKSACQSLHMLVVLSAKFAAQALNLLMDMLNDDAMVVRLEALEALHHMAMCDCLTIKEIHMHMLLGTLRDNNSLLRFASWKVFKMVKLPNLELFRMSVNSLLENLEMYPEDEAGVFSALFSMGRNHGNLASNIVKEVSQEIEPVSEENMGLCSARVAAFLMIAISVPLSHDQKGQTVPPHLFSYAVTMLGRISCALKDIMDQTTLLAYLSRCSRSSSLSGREVEWTESLSCVTDSNGAVGSNMDCNSPVCPSSLQYDEIDEFHFNESRSIPTSFVEYRLDEHDEAKNLVNIISAKVNHIWPMIQSGFANEVLKNLRVCKEELAKFNPELLEFSGVLAFTFQYLRIMELLAKAWEHFRFKVPPQEIGPLEIVLRKLDKRLREMRCRFVGLSVMEELNICELVLLSCILRLSKGEPSCYAATLKKLTDAMLSIELLQQESSIDLSNFVIEVKKIVHRYGMAGGGHLFNLFACKKLISLFSIQQFTFPSRLRYINAELDVCGNDSENPLPFVPGMPMAIPLEITLYNVPEQNRLWLQIRMGEESTQFVFLDLAALGGFQDVKKFPFVAPFYRTPKAVSFTLRVCIVIECPFEDSNLVKVYGGPQHPVAYLCHEKELYCAC